MQFQENNKAIYLQIADAICDGILTENFTPDQRIPSVREYAASIEVNANTVMRSYEHLANNGIIFNKRGIGYFITSDAPDKVRRMRRKELLGTEIATLFRRLQLLGVTPTELTALYTDFCANQPLNHTRK